MYLLVQFSFNLRREHRTIIQITLAELYRYSNNLFSNMLRHLIVGLQK